MVEEAHERSMEFHAWLNPYRAIFDAEKFYEDTTHIHLDTLKSLILDLSSSDSLNTSGRLAESDYTDLLRLLGVDTTLLIYKHPEWFLQYGNKIYFDPGIPEVQIHIANVVKDIVTRYDVDAIHMDDYFYPYKIAGVEFPDSLTFRKYGSTYADDLKDFWRRENVNAIVKILNETIKSVKPYVKFGISPFGVWRNASVDPAGSATKAGQTNYDDLYADVLKW
ncbi:MAG: family 10 glycosylhydrolase, partial [Cyclobacteriaceae bacterium]|nr:family 10 glycosylhydrolase [Cyclobacteriaceae bacterium]